VRTKALVSALLMMMLASPLAAQDITKAGKGKRGVSDSAKSAADKRAEELSKRLDKDKTKETSELGGGPSVDQNAVADQGKKLTPQEIDQLKMQLEGKNRQMIAKLDQIISGDPYNAQKPDWMFQKAELLWELRNLEYLRARADYNQCQDAVGKGTVDESKCKEPAANYEEAQVIYKEILGQYPNYARLDEVLYRLGRGLMEAGKGAEAVKHLTQLVGNYPNSKYLPEAYLSLGEFYFDKNIFGAAKDNYNKVLTFPKYSFYDYAMYKLGWVHYNEQAYRESVETFKKVVERSGEKLGFQNQAINDLIVAFAELDNGWIEARDYFLKMRDKEFTYQKMASMASYLETKGKDDDAVAVYEWFLKERPDDKKVPEWMESIIVAKKKDVNNLEETEKTMNRFIAYLSPEGTWAQKNKAEEGSMSNAELLTESSLAFLATFYHQRAQQKSQQPDYVKAAGYYEQFVKRFPNKPASFDMNFFLGEIYLFNLNRLEDAAKQYQKVVDLFKNNQIPEGIKKEDADAIVKDAAYAVVQSYNELVKNNHPDSILMTMAKAAETRGGVYRTDKENSVDTSKPIPEEELKPLDLLKYEEGFVKASDQWSELYPKDDITPTIDYVAAEVYKSRKQYDRCIPRYESIIKNAPKHKYASFAGASLLDANYRLRRWDDVERWARYMLDNKIFEVTPADGLKQTIAFAINERSRELKAKGETEKAAIELVRLAEEFPKSELAPGALFNAAAIYEGGEQITKAVETYERVVKTYPTSEQASAALFVMGAIFESRVDFERAAGYFERLGTKEYSTRENASDAVLNAAVLREQLGQWDKAIETYEKYIALYPAKEDINTIRKTLAYIEISRKQPKKAYDRFDKYTKIKGLASKELVESYVQMGLLLEEQKGKNWEKSSDELYTKAIKAWGALEGKDKQDTNRYASRARFIQSERIYEQFVKVKFGFPQSALIRALTQKGQLLVDSEKIYEEVISMGHPLWASAAAYRLGSMYKNFSDELYALPMPEGLTPDQEDEYRALLDDRAFPLQEKALARFQAARQLAIRLKAYNEWSKKSAEMISKLESAQFPITNQPGVDPEHVLVQFTTTQPLLKMEVVRERLKARKPAPAPEPVPATPVAPKAESK
jgi:cellulose synthase operon protein C